MILTPAQKAQELFDKFYSDTALLLGQAQEAAIICVEQLITESNGYYDLGAWFRGGNEEYAGVEPKVNNNDRIVYWQEVKKELEKL